VDPSVRIVGRHYLLATAGTGYGALSGDGLTPAVMARARATITTKLPRGTVVDPDAYNPANNLLRVGTLAPDFRAATLAGRRYRLSAQRGHVVVLKFVAMWCSICRQEAPELERLQRTGTLDAHHPRVLAVLGDPYAGTSDAWSSPHPLATAADVAAFARTFGITYPLLVQRNLSASNEYGGPPAIYVIDRQGIIRFASANMVSYAQLAKAVESAALAS
jgi:peroxiredoxin